MSERFARLLRIQYLPENSETLNCCADSRGLSGEGERQQKPIMTHKTMKRRIPHIVSLAAITGLLAIAPNITRAQTTDPLLADPADQAQFPVITAQPVDQVVPAGSNVVLSVQAVYADNYQWQSNGVDIVGQTNTTLVLQQVGVNSAGSYSCNVSQTGGDPVPTRAASVEVETAANNPAVAYKPTAFLAEDLSWYPAHPRPAMVLKEPVRAVMPVM